MADLVEDILTRIAVALERSCEQHDTWQAQQLAWREENVSDSDKRRATVDRQRDDELAEARAMNASLLEQLDRAVANQAVALARLERIEKLEPVNG